MDFTVALNKDVEERISKDDSWYKEFGWEAQTVARETSVDTVLSYPWKLEFQHHLDVRVVRVPCFQA